jgi:Ferritin-like domain
MPNLETQYLDEVIVSRRALLAGGGAALAALTLSAKPAAAQAAVNVYSDNDILNFALNLEYLESNFYYLAAFGTTIDVASSASTAAGAGVMTLSGVIGNNSAGVAAGVVANAGISGAPASSTLKVPFVTPVIAAYAVETAVEEGKHVSLLRSALGSLAVAQPAMNLTPALFDTLAGLAGIPSAARPFNPYANEVSFLLGAYIFEDVGVSAYHGAAPLIISKTGVLPVAAGIMAVEAYHAGLIRTALTVADNAGTYFPVGTLATLTSILSNFRNAAAQAKAQVPFNPEDPNPDDYGLTTQMVTLNAGTVLATQIVDAPPASAPAPATAFARNTNQVLNIVTAGGAVAGSIAKGGFFPNGLNGLFI